MERRKLDIEVRGVGAKPIAKHKSSEHERQQDHQRRFAAREQRRARFARSLCGEMIDELGHSPKNDQNGPVHSNQVAKSKRRIEAVEQENHSDHDE